jgi:hypothetical protein
MDKFWAAGNDNDNDSSIAFRNKKLVHPAGLEPATF